MLIKELNATHQKFKGNLKSGKWTLCIGAGISYGIVPTWMELTRRIVNETFTTDITEEKFKELVSTSAWSLDSWIQACANHYQLTSRPTTDFFNLIEKHLYSDLRKKANEANIEDVLVNVLDRPRNASKENVFRVCNFFEHQYPQSSLLATVQTLLKCIREDQLPEAVISFNADTLLHTLLELFQRRNHYLEPPPHSHPKYEFKPVYRPTDSAKNRTPIYHCHGSIKPKSSSGIFSPRDSRDRLVFLESEYIRVATVASSWSETLFMFHAQTTRMVFVGFSMSDPNMRRWLALSNLSTMQDLNVIAQRDQITPQHIWITLAPGDATIKTLNNEALIHLGVRPGWIDNWSEIEYSLCNLLGI